METKKVKLVTSWNSNREEYEFIVAVPENENLDEALADLHKGPNDTWFIMEAEQIT